MKTKTILSFLAFMFVVSAYADGQEKDSLDNYIGIALKNNPGLNADYLSYKASLQKIPQASAIQDPQLEAGFYPEAMQLVNGKQVAEFKLMQMFPWFGTIKAAKNEASHMANMEYEKYRDTRNNLISEIYTQWYNLSKLRQELDNNRENKNLLLKLKELSIKKFSSSRAISYYSTSSSGMAQSGGLEKIASSGASMGMGSASMGNTSASANSGMSGSGSSSSMGNPSSGMSGVLRIDLEIEELDNNIESLNSEIKANKAGFNALLNRKVDSEIIVPDTLIQNLFVSDLSDILPKIKHSNSMLGMINEEKLSYKARYEMDKKMGYPMWGIGLQYMLIDKIPEKSVSMSGGMSSMNGKDMFMPMISLSIPIYRNKYKAQQKETQLLMNSADAKLANSINLLEAELYREKHLLDDAARRIDLYTRQSKLAKTTYDLSVREFISGKNDLTNVIDIQRQLLDYKLKKAESIADYNTIVADIEKLYSFGLTE